MSKRKPKLTGKPYEELIYKIYQELEPRADTRINDKIAGIESGINREIDISIRHKIGGHEILIIVQAKDHKKAADINILGEFSSVIKDVRASKGILICSSGFTKSAKSYAKNHGIEVCSAHDASEIDWSKEIQIPVLKKKVIISAKLSFTMQAVEGMPGNPLEVSSLLKQNDGSKIDAFELLCKMISTGELSMEEGDYQHVFSEHLSVIAHLYGKVPYEVTAHEATMNYSIKYRHYFKYFTPKEYRGIQNFITDEFILSYLSVDRSNEVFSIVDDKS
ncbi:restriction endonuclease [Hymenobacter coccineus]|uniref:restriction endonuclease n=1 Tax=Hymenobacter coccineus TaxID=1908235 RepID=UPI0009F1933E|nr:restriction endonuclease [Hymenobacter coccineus]